MKSKTELLEEIAEEITFDKLKVSDLMDLVIDQMEMCQIYAEENDDKIEAIAFRALKRNAFALKKGMKEQGF